MKLTKENLKKMVQEVLQDEDELEEECSQPDFEESVDNAEDALKHDQDIIRFYEEVDKEELTAAIQQEIFKGLGKKISGAAGKISDKVGKHRAYKQQGKKNAAERKRVKDHFDKTGECPEGYKEYGAGNCQPAIPDLDISGDLERAGGSKYKDVSDTAREKRDGERFANANPDQQAAMMRHNAAMRGPAYARLREDTLKKIVHEEILKALKK